jgi:integrase
MAKTESKRKPKRENTNPKRKKPSLLDDNRVEALCEFGAEGMYGLYPDKKLPGLFLLVGPRKTAWRYHTRYMVNGKRKIEFKTLGYWPEINTAEARRRAGIEIGRTAQKIDKPVEPDPVRVDVAFAVYLDYLKSKAERNGKPPRWHYNAKKLADKIILPEFGSWTLADLAKKPGVVADFHERVTKDHGPVSANHCARLIRAAYKRAARRDISLPDRLPTSAVEFNRESASQKALLFADFPKWLEAWRSIDSGIRQAYHLANLLTGARPGELARLRWGAYNKAERNLVIAKSKNGQDIVIPVSPEIAAALAMARADAVALDHSVDADALIFPGCSQAGRRDDLPAAGHMLRHTYKTVGANLGIDDLISHFLMGHAPEGISQKYIAILMFSNGPKMREEQGRMSREFVRLLGCDIDKEISSALARSRVAGKVRAAQRAKQLARAQRASARARRGGRLETPREAAE